MKKNSHLRPLRVVSAALQTGFSLIELMVSLTIGMVLILFVSNLYLGSKSTTRIQDENARMQESGRSAMHLLGRSIKQAWFGKPVTMSKDGLLTSFTGQGLAGCNGHFTAMNNFADTSCSGTGPSSSLHVSYQFDGVANPAIGAGVDCNGQSAPPDATPGMVLIANRFFLQKPANEANLALYCLGNGGPVAQPIISNVENMVLTYGIDTPSANGKKDKSADIFTNSANDALTLTPQSANFPAFKDVVSVGVCLQLVSNNEVTSEPQAYTNCDGAKVTANDRKLRLVLKNVFAIRNSSGTSLLAPNP